MIKSSPEHAGSSICFGCRSRWRSWCSLFELSELFKVHCARLRKLTEAWRRSRVWIRNFGGPFHLYFGKIDHLRPKCGRKEKVCCCAKLGKHHRIGGGSPTVDVFLLVSPVVQSPKFVRVGPCGASNRRRLSGGQW